MLLADARQIREADAMMIEELEFPGLLLMEAAGRQATERILHHYAEAPHFIVLAGHGNNGGDGWVIARHLYRAEKSVTVITSHHPSRLKGDARTNFQIIEKQISWEVFDHHEAESMLYDLPENSLVIDALLGTGVSSELRDPFFEILEFFRRFSFPVAAIDLPSGLSADTGALINEPLPAAHTFTFQLPKLCHYITPAATYCGEIEVIDIGIWPEIIDAMRINREVLEPMMIDWLGNREKEGHKGTFGHALLVGGSRNMAGAIAMAGKGALHAGAGLSTCLIPASARCALYENALGVMTVNIGADSTELLSSEHVDTALESLVGKAAVAIGPGMGNTPETQAFLKGFLPQVNVPMVIDADGLNILASTTSLLKKLPADTILTPHPGEMARLAGRNDVQEYRLEVAEAFAQKYKVIVLLKGANSIVAFPDGRTFVNPTGNPGMGTAGMGDVLTGMLTGFLAQGYTAEEAALMSVYLHGRAGDILAAEISESGVTAEGVLPTIGKALLELEQFHHQNRHNI